MHRNKNRQIRISFSKAGVPQKADFLFNRETGELLTRTFCASYSKPQVLGEDINTDEEVLAAVKEYAYGNRAEITHIDYKNVTYAHTFETAFMDERIEGIYDKLVTALWAVYVKELVPILNRKKWFFESSHVGYLVLAYFNEEGEMDNIPDRDEDNKLMNNMLKHFFDGLRIDGNHEQPWHTVQRYTTGEELNKFLKIKPLKQDEDDNSD